MITKERKTDLPISELPELHQTPTKAFTFHIFFLPFEPGKLRQLFPAAVFQLRSPQFRPGSFNPRICTAQVLVEVAVVELNHPVLIAAAVAITFATEFGDVAWIFKVELGDAATVPAVGTANAIAVDVDVGDVHGDVAFAV